MDWKSERNRIELCRNETYLMSAAAGILHPDALAASKGFLEQLHRHGDKFWELNLQALEETRKLAADLLHSKAEEICFVSSSSMAMSIAAHLLKSKGYTKFLSFQEEFPTTSLPWVNLGYQGRFLQSKQGVHFWENVRAEHRQDELLVLSSVESLTGFAHPMKEVVQYAIESEIPLVVNATQSLGLMPLDASQIPFVCASIHKWLMSGFGLSIFKVDTRYLDAPLPVYGWLSQKDPWKFFDHQIDPLREAKVFELGCGPLLQILSLGAVLKWIKRMGGVEEIWAWVHELVNYTYQKSNEMGLPLRYSFESNCRSGLIFFPVKDALAAEKILLDQNIYVSARAENIRIAIHWFNNHEDIDRFLMAYQKIIESA